MWCIRMRAWQSSPLLILVSFVIAAGLVVQLKTLYDNHQRHLRVMDYERSVVELSDTMEHVEKVTTKIGTMRRKIEGFLATHKGSGS